VPAELHVFSHGRHGMGLAQDDPVVSQWKRLCAKWMEGLTGAPVHLDKSDMTS
jgi:hypothetical protein